MESKAWCIIPHSRNKGKTVEIEMQPLVLCSDCKWYNRIPCPLYTGDPNDEPHSPDWFCADGEMKDEEAIDNADGETPLSR